MCLMLSVDEFRVLRSVWPDQNQIGCNGIGNTIGISRAGSLAYMRGRREIGCCSEMLVRLKGLNKSFQSENKDAHPGLFYAPG